MSIKKENFKESLGTWYNKLEPLFDDGTMDKIFTTLKNRSREGYKILPQSELVFRCFRECPIDDLKLVMMGMAPYHTLRNNIPVADGLLMSCANTGILQPSLSQYYSAIEREFKDGMDLGMIEEPDLTFLASQGVLLYNASLTTELGKTGAHIDLWKPFTTYLLEEVISLTGVPVIFLGKDAAKYKRCLAPMQWSFITEHPAAASYRNEKWDSKGTFTKVNKILKDMNNEEIIWCQTLPF